jgi:hypothetical protein
MRQFFRGTPLFFDKIRSCLLVEICGEVPVPGDPVFLSQSVTSTLQYAVKRREQIPEIVLGLDFGRLRLPCPALWHVRPIAHRQPISPALPQITAANLSRHAYFSIFA